MSAEACLYATINQIVTLGLSPLITNDYRTWLFPHDLGVNLKDDALDEPHGTLEMQILSCFLNSKTFEYTDDCSPMASMEGMFELSVKITDGCGFEKLDKIIDMPVLFDVVCNNTEWTFECFTSNYGLCFINDEYSRFDISIDRSVYDYSVLTDSPKQSIILSTCDRITRMKRLLFQEWDFQ